MPTGWDSILTVISFDDCYTDGLEMLEDTNLIYNSLLLRSLYVHYTGSHSRIQTTSTTVQCILGSFSIKSTVNMEAFGFRTGAVGRQVGCRCAPFTWAKPFGLHVSVFSLWAYMYFILFGSYKQDFVVI